MAKDVRSSSLKTLGLYPRIWSAFNRSIKPKK